MKRFVVLLAFTLLITSCDIFEDYEKVYYYDIGAEGYVYYDEKPIPDFDVFISSELSKSTSFQEKFTTNSSGYFYAKLPIKKGYYKVLKSNVWVYNDTLYNYNEISIDLSDIRKCIDKSEKNIQLGNFILIKKQW